MSFVIANCNTTDAIAVFHWIKNDLTYSLGFFITHGTFVLCVCYVDQQLVEWSGELGSDITFFLSHGTAYCTGRGEIMQTIDPPLPLGTKLCIVKPSVGLSTPSVFQALDYQELSTLDPDNILLPTFLQGIEQVPDEYFVNDLEPPAFRCLPELAALKEELLQVRGFNHVMMSGSGTSIFCLGEPEDRAAFEKTFAQRDNLQVFFSEFTNRARENWYDRT